MNDIAQLAGFMVFPLFRRRFSRRTLYTAATATIVAGYVAVLLRADGHDLDRHRRGIVVVLSGINSAATSDDVSADGLLMMRVAMLFLPPVLIVAGYLIYRAKYRIDEPFCARIVADLADRGQLAPDLGGERPPGAPTS